MRLEILGLVQKWWSYPHINSCPQRKKKKQKERKDYDYYYYVSYRFLYEATGAIKSLYFTHLCHYNSFIDEQQT